MKIPDISRYICEIISLFPAVWLYENLGLILMLMGGWDADDGGEMEVRWVLTG